MGGMGHCVDYYIYFFINNSLLNLNALETELLQQRFEIIAHLNNLVICHFISLMKIVFFLYFIGIVLRVFELEY